MKCEGSVWVLEFLEGLELLWGFLVRLEASDAADW